MKSVRSGAFRNIKSPINSALFDNPVGSRARGFELDLRLREFEINQLTQRNNFFMIFQGVLVSGLIQSQGTAAPVITFSMSLLGLATSMLQVGMAGGAKYWQSRWEASTRSSEIAILFDLIREDKLAVQTFTHDSSVLSKNEQQLIKDWNSNHPNPIDQIRDSPDYIHSVVTADIKPSSKRPIRGALDWWVRTFAIAPKWSVSRIPIWIAAVLLIFWIVIVANTVHVKGSLPSGFISNFFELVPLKVDAK